METIRVSAEEYEKTVLDRRVFFNEPKFTELNKDKADDVLYLVTKKGNSPRFGVIIGKCGGVGRSPFSAPYAYPVTIRNDAGVQDFDDALASIEEYCLREGIRELRFVFPPFLYDEDVLSAWASSMYRAGYRLSNVDINYTLDLCKLNTAEYPQMLGKKARSHLRKAMNSGIDVIRCKNDEDYKEAYDIIVENHTLKDRPTHMTYEQVKNTFKLVYHEAFIARLNGKPIASMIYYEITKEIVQCIYSGYLLEYSNSGVMNYLSWYAIRFFGDKGYKYIDRAIATEDSMPNYGLCDFKESVGCERSLKFSFRKELKKEYNHDD